ncbi:MAG: hypothetical protein ABFS39_09425 [Pseudomonadota bacterium]
MESCVPLVTTFLLISMLLGTAWAHGETIITDPPADDPQPSNIESWDEEEDPASTWFGMGFESRKSDLPKPGQQSTDRIVNNW